MICRELNALCLLAQTPIAMTNERDPSALSIFTLREAPREPQRELRLT
jgi:hypothetical protein